MIRVCALTATLTLLVPTDGFGGGFDTRLVRSSGSVPDSLIVGRATCRGVTWLLTATAQLVAINLASHAVTVHSVEGLIPGDRLWGLACLADGTLWTLPSPQALARLSAAGRMMERQDVRLPRVGLFSTGARLLFQQLPAIAAAPALATSPAGHPLDVRPWPGLLNRATAARADQLAHNLVNCGIGIGALVPCWFANDGLISVSDGVSVRIRAFAGLRSPPVDQTAPIWDAALAGSERLWMLTTVAAKESGVGRRAGGRLILLNARNLEEDRLELNPPARLLLSVSDMRCLILTVRGDLLEVSIR